MISAMLLALLGLDDSKLIGKWSGSFKPGPQTVTLNLELRQDAGTWKGTAKSPQLGNESADLADLSIENGKIAFKIREVGISYSGSYDLSSDTIRGKIKRKSELDLAFNPGWAVKPVVRTQTPKPQFPYEIKPFDLVLSDGVRMTGIETIPKKFSSTVILISGAGPQDADCTVLDHKPFLVLADHLARKGIRTIRFNDRGVEGSSGIEGEAGLARLGKDVFDLAKSIRSETPISLLGFSQGCKIAAVAADEMSGAKLVLLSPIAVDEMSLIQKLEGGPLLTEILERAKTSPDRKERIALTDKAPANLRELALGILGDQASVDSLDFRLLDHLKGRKFLAVLGDLDRQYDSKQSTELLSKLEGGKSVLKKGLNHLLQPAKSGDVTEVRDLKVTIDPSVLKLIADFLLAK